MGEACNAGVRACTEVYTHCSDQPAHVAAKLDAEGTVGVMGFDASGRVWGVVSGEGRDRCHSVARPSHSTLLQDVDAA